MENNFKNLNYKLINSSLKEHHEVCVSFIYNGKSVKRFIYVKDKKNAKGLYYISEAKKRIDEEIKNGKLLEYAKKYIKNKDKKDHRKGILIFFVIFIGAAAITLASLFTWMYLTKGGDVPPGPDTYTVSAAITNSDVAVGYSLDYKDKAKDNEDYQTTIKLNKSADAPRECFLPPAIKYKDMPFVTVKINDSDYNQFTYTPSTETRDIIEAELSIPHDAITGNVVISITVISKEPIKIVTVRLDDETDYVGKLAHITTPQINKRYEGVITLNNPTDTLDTDNFSVKNVDIPLVKGPDYDITQDESETYKYTLTIFENKISADIVYIHAPLAQ